MICGWQVSLMLFLPLNLALLLSLFLILQEIAKHDPRGQTHEERSNQEQSRWMTSTKLLNQRGDQAHRCKAKKDALPIGVFPRHGFCPIGSFAALLLRKHLLA